MPFKTYSCSTIVSFENHIIINVNLYYIINLKEHREQRVNENYVSILIISLV